MTGEEEEERLDPRVVEGCRTNVTAPAPRSRPLPGAIKVLAPENGAYAGYYAIPPSVADYRTFKQKTGATPPIVFTFHDWVNDEYLGDDNPKLNRMSDPFPDSETGLTPLQFAEQLADDGAVLALAWAVYCCDPESPFFLLKLKKPWNIFNRILNGDFDNYIRTVAREIKAFGKPIMLSLTGEFNSQAIFMFGRDGTKWLTSVDNICNEYGDPTWPDGPERIRDFYRHVIDLFREEGVRNVTWFIYASA
ncbi:MAG: hypothetical protein KJO38_05430, partial [Gammaproteobacteria bacterium]|nr:hypothetical protein [Gammaproteobacteria bacterium]